MDAFDRRAVLTAQRDLLWDALQACGDQRGLASISKELRAVVAELDAMPEPGKVTQLDDARAEYARLVAVTDVPASAAGAG